MVMLFGIMTCISPDALVGAAVPVERGQPEAHRPWKESPKYPGHPCPLLRSIQPERHSR